jgi:hypothetical protein
VGPVLAEDILGGVICRCSGGSCSSCCSTCSRGRGGGKGDLCKEGVGLGLGLLLEGVVKEKGGQMGDSRAGKEDGFGRVLVEEAASGGIGWGLIEGDGV